MTLGLAMSGTGALCLTVYLIVLLFLYPAGDSPAPRGKLLAVLWPLVVTAFLAVFSVALLGMAWRRAAGGRGGASERP